MNTSRLLLVSLLPLFLSGCGNFRKLSSDLKLLDESYRIGGVIENSHDFKVPVWASVIEWDPKSGEVFSGDRVQLSEGAAFGFVVKSPRNQHVTAYADSNRNGRYDPREPFWSTDVKFEEDRKVKVTGRLDASNTPAAGLREAIDRMLAGRKVEEVISRRGVKFSLGEIADLDDPRFAATRGEDGLWTPATMAITHGFGIYFLEPYDPSRTPVLFVHGAAGSPQDWRHAMGQLDRRRYQPWFYFYPSGGRLEEAARALNDGVELLHRRYGFDRLHVVAHSMGGLVARRFVQINVIDHRQTYINTFITVSTPWAGHERAASGVKWAPSVVPSWRDMEEGSPFLTHLYDKRLKGKVNHHLFYGHLSSRSVLMPSENDGTVSVASELRPEAKSDAVSVQGYKEDHMSILSSRPALLRAKRILDASD
ncbi:MAG TPA: alpha/beta fold hydrolase [Luteolibacter sp.]|nr:alpha/beta fold hydrolase [Luteolibacter sp.]